MKILDERRTTIETKTQLGRDELRADDVHRMLERLLLENLTGSITIHTNRGGVCEISFSEKS